MKKLIIICFALLSYCIISAKDIPKASLPVRSTLVSVNIRFNTEAKRKNAMKVIRDLKKKVSLRMGHTRLYFGPAGKGVGLTLKF